MSEDRNDTNVHLRYTPGYWYLHPEDYFHTSLRNVCRYRGTSSPSSFASQSVFAGKRCESAAYVAKRVERGMRSKGVLLVSCDCALSCARYTPTSFGLGRVPRKYNAKDDAFALLGLLGHSRSRKENRTARDDPSSDVRWRNFESIVARPDFQSQTSRRVFSFPLDARRGSDAIFTAERRVAPSSARRSHDTEHVNDWHTTSQ